MRRADRICVASFDPPDAGQHFEAWKLENLDRYGPSDDWLISIGRHISGHDFVAVWVLEKHAQPPPG